MNVNAMGVFVILSGVVLTLGLVLVLRYRWFIKQMEKEDGNRQRISMLKDKPSYEKYKRIASRKSVRSNPVREEGKFLDFLLSHENKDDENAIESKLANVAVGEEIFDK